MSAVVKVTLHLMTNHPWASGREKLVTLSCIKDLRFVTFLMTAPVLVFTMLIPMPRLVCGSLIASKSITFCGIHH